MAESSTLPTEAATHHLKVYRGKTKVEVLTFTDKDSGAAVAISDAWVTVRADRENATALLALTTLSGIVIVGNVVTITWPDLESATWGSGYYDTRVKYTATGEEEVVREGLITLVRGVTR